MKAAIYNPYLDTLGGGERYTMAVATTLANLSYIVDVEWKDSKTKEKLEKRFDIDLSKINFIDDIKRGDGYDVCFWVSDGSIPTLRARKNFLHFQVPFTNVGGASLINKFKLMRINKIICNSNFTKKVIDKEYGVNSVVLYPPVAVEKFKPKKKENLILNVARFSSLMQSKRQDVLIKTFKAFSEANESWKLILAGGAEVGAKEFVDKLEKDISGLPIEIIKSPDFKVLKQLYGRAKIFWSASGFGIDEQKEPKKTEHFGIASVEAMAAGCVPIITYSGGHKEIITNGVDGFLWSDAIELYRYTLKVVKNEKLRKVISLKARKDSEKFSYAKFEKTFTTLL
jgi:glycosyltransferase involved in cell wall biosynthesis